MEHNPLGKMYCVLLSGHYLPTKENWSLPKCSLCLIFLHTWNGEHIWKLCKHTRTRICIGTWQNIAFSWIRCKRIFYRILYGLMARSFHFHLADRCHPRLTKIAECNSILRKPKLIILKNFCFFIWPNCKDIFTL